MFFHLYVSLHDVEGRGRLSVTQLARGSVGDVVLLFTMLKNNVERSIIAAYTFK